MLAPHRVFAWTLAVGCLTAATANAQRVGWNLAQRPNAPRGFGGGMPGPQFGAPANNFGAIPGTGVFNMPFGALGLPAGLNVGLGGMIGGGMMNGMIGGGMMNGMGGGGMMNGMGMFGGGMVNGMNGGMMMNGGLMNGGLVNGGMMNGMGGFGGNNGFGSPFGAVNTNGPFGNPANNPLSYPFNNSFNSPLTSPFLSPFNSPLNGGYVGNGFNGPMLMNPAFSNPFNVFPQW